MPDKQQGLGLIYKLLEESHQSPQQTRLFPSPLTFPLRTDFTGPSTPSISATRVVPCPVQRWEQETWVSILSKWFSPSSSHQVDPRLPLWLIQLCRAGQAPLFQLRGLLCICMLARFHQSSQHTCVGLSFLRAFAQAVFDFFFFSASVFPHAHTDLSWC